MKSSANQTSQHSAPEVQQWEKALVVDFLMEIFNAGKLRAATNFSFNKDELDKSFQSFIDRRDSEGKSDDGNSVRQKLRNIDAECKIEQFLKRSHLTYTRNRINKSRFLACLEQRRNQFDEALLKEVSLALVKNSDRNTNESESTKLYPLIHVKTCYRQYGAVENIDDIEQMEIANTKYLDVHFLSCKNVKELEVKIEMTQARRFRLQRIFINRNGLIESHKPDTKPSDPVRTYALMVKSAGKLDYISIVFRIDDDDDDDDGTIYLEQHEFLHNYLPKVGIIPKHSLPMKSKLTFNNKLDVYKPTQKLVEALKDTGGACYNDEVPLLVRDYLIHEKCYTIDNIYEAMSALLQIEDTHIMDEFKRIRLTKVTLNFIGVHVNHFRRIAYSVDFNSEDAVQIDNVLTTYDAIVLLPDDEQGNYDEERIRWLPTNRATWNLDGRFIFFGAVTKIRSSTVEFECEFKLPESVTYSVLFLPSRLLLCYQYRALELMRGLKSAHIERLLFPAPPEGEADAEYDIGLYDFNLKYENPNIVNDPEQLAAVKRIARSSVLPAPYIIFGPPGTGKTSTIVEAIWQLLSNRADAKVLVMAQSNTACDELAIRFLHICKRYNRQDELVRIYSRAKEKERDTINKELLYCSNIFYEHFYPDLEVLHARSVIVCTLGVAGRLALSNFGRDIAGKPLITHIFVDEASFATEPEILMGIVPALSPQVNLILSGDHKQLGPIVQSKDARELGLGVSIMERLLKRPCYAVDRHYNYNPQIQSRLRRNYRSHSSIVRIFNTLYYNGEIKPVVENAACALTSDWTYLRNSDFRVLFHYVYGTAEKDNIGTSYYNSSEIRTVLDYVKDFMFFGINGRPVREEDIGIVTPYKRQYSIMRERLRQRNWLNIECGSAELYQGKEKEIIIVSFVRSGTKSLGFVDDPRRLNVMLSRAKSLLILIGNPETLETSADLKYVIDACKSSYRRGRQPTYAKPTSLAKELNTELTLANRADSITELQSRSSGDELDHDAILKNLPCVKALLKAQPPAQQTNGYTSSAATRVVTAAPKDTLGSQPKPPAQQTAPSPNGVGRPVIPPKAALRPSIIQAAAARPPISTNVPAYGAPQNEAQRRERVAAAMNASSRTPLHANANNRFVLVSPPYEHYHQAQRTSRPKQKQKKNCILL